MCESYAELQVLKKARRCCKVFRESCLDLTEGDIVEVVAGQLCCFFDPSLK